MNKELFSFLGIKFFPAIVNFLLVPLVYQRFGSHIYGEYSLIVSVIFVIITFATGLLIHAIYRFYESENEGQYFALAIFISTLTSCGFFVFTTLFHNADFIINVVSSLFIFFGVLYSLLLVVCQMKLGKSRILLCEAARVLVLLIFILFYSSGKNESLALLFLLIFNVAAYAIPTIFLLIPKLNLKFKGIRFSWVITHFKFGIHISIWLSTCALLWLINRFYIDSNFDDHTLGYYSSLFDILYKSVSLLAAAFSMMLYPKISKLLSEKLPVHFLISKSCFSFFVLSFCALIFAYFIGPLVFNLMFAEKFQSSDIVYVLFPLLIYQFAIVLQKPIEILGNVMPLTTFMLLSVVSHILALYLCSLWNIPLFASIAIAGACSSLQYLLCISVLYYKFRKRELIR